MEGLTSGKTYPYGFGWGIDQSKGAPWYHHSGSWQGFKLYFSRYLADDLAIAVLANLSDATPWRFVDGIASLIDPQLALTQPVTPIADDNPSATAQVRAWLEALAQGQLAPEQFASTGAELEKQLKDHAALLGPLLAFTFQLAQAKRTGLREYGTLAERYVREFDAKWVRGSAPVDEP